MQMVLGLGVYVTEAVSEVALQPVVGEKHLVAHRDRAA